MTGDGRAASPTAGTLAHGGGGVRTPCGAPPCASRRDALGMAAFRAKQATRRCLSYTHLSYRHRLYRAASMPLRHAGALISHYAITFLWLPPPAAGTFFRAVARACSCLYSRSSCCRVRHLSCARRASRMAGAAPGAPTASLLARYL